MVNQVSIIGKKIEANSTSRGHSLPKVSKPKKAEIRIGGSYQADIPPIKKQSQAEDGECLSYLVYRPSNKVSEEQFEEFIKIAKNKYGHGVEMAHNAMCWGGHDLKAAESILSNYHPNPMVEWSKADRVLFEQGFKTYGKDFFKIKINILVNKSVQSIVKYYYERKMVEKRKQKRKLDEDNERKDSGFQTNAETSEFHGHGNNDKRVKTQK